MATISIVEDDDGFAELLARSIRANQGLQLLSTSTSGEDALRDLTQYDPDVVLMDINLPGISGIDCLKELKMRTPPVHSQVVILTEREDSDFIFEGLKWGAVGYLLKDHIRPEEIYSKIKEVLAGGGVMSPTVARKVMSQYQCSPATGGLRGPVPPVPGVGGEISVPDYSMLRRIGEGAYGEVWLACNAIGIYRAVKIVRRDRFPDAMPYEREFKGMQKFMPISLNHPGVVHLLHVGRNEAAGYFYYIMELGDDQLTGQRIDPDTYSSRNLAGDLQKRKRFPLRECVSLSLALTETLEYLHQQGLIHRDIKPSNIIFVNDVPKFADVGLVTDLAGDSHDESSQDVSYVGTEGYTPLDEPSSPAADIYSLGKVIYEVGMGRDRREFPQLPRSIMDQAHIVEFFELNRIILRACAADHHKRYQSAAEMHADFLRLKQRLTPEETEPPSSASGRIDSVVLNQWVAPR
jgi:DNA-binding NarL/FixJ family response regulator